MLFMHDGEFLLYEMDVGSSEVFWKTAGGSFSHHRIDVGLFACYSRATSNSSSINSSRTEELSYPKNNQSHRDLSNILSSAVEPLAVAFNPVSSLRLPRFTLTTIPPSESSPPSKPTPGTKTTAARVKSQRPENRNRAPGQRARKIGGQTRAECLGRPVQETDGEDGGGTMDEVKASFTGGSADSDHHVPSTEVGWSL